MTKPIEEFAAQFSIMMSLPPELVVKSRNRYFLLSVELKKVIKKDYCYAGVYLGELGKGRFYPSFNLLRLIAEIPEANKVFVDAKAEWLFICGRDLFHQGITKITGSKKKGNYTLVLNQHGECLGYGKICDLDKEKGKIAIKNIMDLGDFLRRENHRRLLRKKSA